MQIIEKIKNTFIATPVIKQIRARLKFRRVPISDIRCQEMPFSEIQGFSGKPINHFPPCQFFQMHLTDKEKAFRLFCKWLYHCLIDLKAWEISKQEGGWQNGSLVCSIYELHKDNGINLTCFEDANHSLIKKTIEFKANYYFDLFLSIKNNGLSMISTPPITCVYKNGLYYLRGGHHRVSALYALGIKDVYVCVHRQKGPITQ